MSAEVLVEALPYIQEYAGKIIVVKYGGNAMINEDLKQAVIEDIVLLNLVGIKVVLVHGGGPEISEKEGEVTGVSIECVVDSETKKPEKSLNLSKVCATQTARRWILSR